METVMHFADFSFCNACKHKDTYEADEPCHSCLETAMVPNSPTGYPINYDGPKVDGIKRRDRDE